MKLGVFSNTVGGGSPEQVAERSRHLGIEAVQLRLEWPGLDLLVSAVDRARVRRAYESVGIEIAALAAYTNLMAPDPQTRRRNHSWFSAVARVAPELGTRLVVTESGSYHPTDTWQDHPANHTPQAQTDLAEVIAPLAELCEGEGVTLALEPYVANVLASAGQATQLAATIGSPALGFVLDTAGLVTPETLPRNADVTAEALIALAGRIVLAHTDDVRYDAAGQATWLPLGWGDLDAEAFLHGLAHSGFQGALIIEHLAEALVPQALAFCRERLRPVGRR